MSPLPWAAILTHGPALVAAANKLLARSGTTKVEQRPDTADGRLAMLEQRSEESARLLQGIAQQLDALGAAQVAAARRVQVAVRLSVAAVALAGVAIVVAFLM